MPTASSPKVSWDRVQGRGSSFILTPSTGRLALRDSSALFRHLLLDRLFSEKVNFVGPFPAGRVLHLSLHRSLVHPHTVMAWPCTRFRNVLPFPDDGGGIAVARRVNLLRGSTIPHKRPVHAWAGTKFNWALEGNANAAQRFLTPSVQQAMAAAPREEWWYVGRGWICCVFVGKLDGDQLAHFVAHGRGVVSAIG